ncbi:hypothetical protein CEXT_687651 [Caerostris extrusa]|uniref:Uncharacterized protein n=1 Tax=Caerostris extrusa TaxID=172846 RepID=A0AAV4TYR3_CAEEX|nr:hypothetical protein CEXT_687651 [Caerostris extrusa]
MPPEKRTVLRGSCTSRKTETSRCREREESEGESENSSIQEEAAYLTLAEKEGGVPKVGHHCPNEPAIWSDPTNCPRVVGWTDKAATCCMAFSESRQFIHTPCFPSLHAAVLFSLVVGWGLRGCPSEVSLVPSPMAGNMCAWTSPGQQHTTL